MNRNATTAVLLLAALGLTGCSHLPSWMGGTKTEKPKLEGERIAVLPVDADLQPDPALKTTAVTLPPVNKNADWPAHSGMFSAGAANLAGGSFDTITSATAGDGEGFESTLLITPVVGGGMVFAMDALGTISAHDSADIGNRKWKGKGVAQDDDSPVMGGGLAYGDGKLFAASGRGVVAAFDAATGKELWRKALHVPFRSAPALGAGKLFAVTLDNQLYALNTADGEVSWTQRGISETTGLMSTVSPVVAGDMVVAPYSSGELYVLSVADGREIWSDSLSGGKRLQASALFSGIGGDPVVDGAVLFAASSGGLLTVKALANGQPAWGLPIGTTNTPWIAGDYLFLLSSEHTLLALHKFDGHIRWATRLPGFEDEAKKKDPITWKGPVLVDGKLALVSSNGQLKLINALDGTVAATKEIPENIFTSPVVAGSKMYLMGQDATLYELQ